MTLTPEEIQYQNKEFTVTRKSLKALPEPHLTGMKLEGNIILGDFIFNTIDFNGITWVITDIENWWDNPTAEVNDIPRGYGDGSYDVQGRYASRSLTIQGSILVPEPSMLEAARDRLVEASNLVYRGAWLKTGSGPVRASWVRLVGKVEIKTVSARGRADFSIPLRAPDPIKYEWNEADPEGYFVEEISGRDVNSSGSGSGTVLNVGNYSVPVLLEVVGPLVGPASIFNTKTNELVIITTSLKGTTSTRVENKQLTFDDNSFTDIAQLTTKTPHNLIIGDQIFISGVDENFNGDYVIETIPTDTTLTYKKIPLSSKIYEITYKELSSSLAILETVEDNDLSIGDSISVFDVDTLFNGTYTITSKPTSKKVSYAKTRVPAQVITGATLVSNIATITTSAAHQFVVGDTVTVQNVNINYNGTYSVLGILNANQFSYSATRTNAKSIVQISMEILPGSPGRSLVNVVTDSPHGYVVSERVQIDNIDSIYNGLYTINSIVSPTVFTYIKSRSTQKNAAIKYRFSNSAAITTSEANGVILGEKVSIFDVDSSFNGTFTTTGTPSNVTFTYANSGSDIDSTQIIAGNMHIQSRKIGSRSLQGNIITINTKNPHGAFVGESVSISDMDNPVFNGTYTITSTPGTNTLTYSKQSVNIAFLELADAVNAFAEFNSTIPAKNTEGLSTVSGSLPFTAISGTASVADNFPRTISSGVIVKKVEIPFTPGVLEGVVGRDADILEIETQDREVAFNGDTVGARGSIDVLADFIQLAPGENEITFEDNGTLESKALLKVYYRPGWLS
jgi:hypothetical protein